MISLKYFILSSIIGFLAILITLGCNSQRSTKIFELTPIGSMEDSVTTPERLTKELFEELKLKDAKRIKMLQEIAKEKKEKGNTSTEKKIEEPDKTK